MVSNREGNARTNPTQNVRHILDRPRYFTTAIGEAGVQNQCCANPLAARSSALASQPGITPKSAVEVAGAARAGITALLHWSRLMGGANCNFNLVG